MGSHCQKNIEESLQLDKLSTVKALAIPPVSVSNILVVTTEPWMKAGTTIVAWTFLFFILA